MCRDIAQCLGQLCGGAAWRGADRHVVWRRAKMPEQVSDGPANLRVHPVLGNLGRGLKHEGSPGQAGVRNQQVSGVPDEFVIEQEIEIDRSRVPASLPHASQLILDVLKHGKQFRRGQRDIQHGRGIEKPPLSGGPTNRLRFPERACLSNVDGTMRAQSLKATLESRVPVTEIGTKSDQAAWHGAGQPPQRGERSLSGSGDIDGDFSDEGKKAANGSCRLPPHVRHAVLAWETEYGWGGPPVHD